MDTRLFPPWTRREFLGQLTAASAAGVLGLYPGIGKAEPPPETTSIKIVFDPEFWTVRWKISRGIYDEEIEFFNRLEKQLVLWAEIPFHEALSGEPELEALMELLKSNNNSNSLTDYYRVRAVFEQALMKHRRAAVLSAAWLWKHRHGEFPKNIDALGDMASPEFMIDTFSGRRFSLRINEGQPAIDSPGDDLKEFIESALSDYEEGPD